MRLALDPSITQTTPLDTLTLGNGPLNSVSQDDGRPLEINLVYQVRGFDCTEPFSILVFHEVNELHGIVIPLQPGHIHHLKDNPPWALERLLFSDASSQSL